MERIREPSLRLGRMVSARTPRGPASPDRHNYPDLFEHAPEAYLVTDDRGVVLTANALARALLGGEARPGRPMTALVAERERSRLHTLLRGIAPGAEPRHWEFTAAIVSTLRRLEATITAGPGAGEQQLRWILRDVTAPRVAEDRRREREAMRVQARQLFAASELVTQLAHELNQPLAAIINYARGCERRLRAEQLDPPLLDAALQDIVAQAVRAGDAIRRLRGGLGRSQARLEKLDLNLVAREAVALARLDPAGRRSLVRLEAARHLPQVYADALQMEQVLLKLIATAVQRGEAVPACEGLSRVVVRTLSRAGRVEVEVSKEECRGEAADAKALSDRSASACLNDDLDMELNLSRRLIESMGGQLQVAGAGACGTRLSFTLPAL